MVKFTTQHLYELQRRMAKQPNKIADRLRIVRMPVELSDAERDCARDLAKTQAANDEDTAPAAA